MKAFRIITVLLTIALCVTIFCLSAENATESSATSRGIIKKVIALFIDDFENLSKAKQKEICAPFQFVVRKSAHFCLYFLLGTLAFLSVLTYDKIASWLKVSIGIDFAFLYAVSDEIHQRFVPGRSGELRDTLIDLSGAVIGVFITVFIVKRTKKYKHFLK